MFSMLRFGPKNDRKLPNIAHEDDWPSQGPAKKNFEWNCF